MRTAPKCGILIALTGMLLVSQELPKLKPGFNLFSKEQDVQLGKEAAAKVSQQYTIVRDPELAAYIGQIGKRLTQQSEAGDYPYSFAVVHDASINAFALPGGPTFVHTGLIDSVDNEAQLAGVLAHEISHVALRHGTNQASKAQLIQLPALLAESAVGGDASLLGRLAQVGIGVGANSVLLKYSRNAERDADLLGAQIMAHAGYNPLAMAHFFEKLEASGGARGPQFLSDHPNPGNRVTAVEEEIRAMPAANYQDGDMARLNQMKARVRALGQPPKRKPAQ